MNDIISEINQKLNNIKTDKDTNLLPENLKKGITFLGVNGNLQSKTEIKLENVDPLETPYGVEYPFTLEDDKYISSNVKHANSFSYGKLYFVSDGVNPLSFAAENCGYFEHNISIFSNVDNDLELSNQLDSDYFIKLNHVTTRTLTYPIVSKGLHYITFKFIKDSYGTPSGSEDCLKINSENFPLINTSLNVFGVKTKEELEELNPNNLDYCVIKNDNALYLYLNESWKEIFSNTFNPLTINSEDIYGEDIIWFDGKEIKTGGSLQNNDELTKEQFEKRITVYDNFSELTLPKLYIINKQVKTVPILNMIEQTNLDNKFYSTKNLTGIILKNMSNVTNMDDTFNECYNLKYAFLGDTSNVIDMSGLFLNCRNLEYVNLDTSNVTDISRAFCSCHNLKYISGLNTSNVTNMESTFSACENLEYISGLDTSNVTDMESTFQYCGIKNVSLNIPNVTSLESTFKSSKAETIVLLNSSKVNTLYESFRNCQNLKNISLDTSSVTNMIYTFDSCLQLETISFNDTSNVTKMDYTFYKCENLKNILGLDTSNVINMSNTFYGCTNLETIPELNTSNVTNMKSIFQNCKNLKSVPELDTSNITDMSFAFCGCTNLETIPELDTTNADLNWAFHSCASLSDESINNVLAMCQKSKNTADSNKEINWPNKLAIRAANLSNYQGFKDAGWKISSY